MYNMIIVDDETLELELISALKVWNRYGINVSNSFEKPSDALNYMDKNRIDIVLSDICMGEMSGIDFLKIVRQRFPNVIFVFITAYNNFEYTHTAIINNVFDYIMKPIRSDDIKALCERMTDKLSNSAENNEPNLAMLKCQQAIIDYCSKKISVPELQTVFGKNDVIFDIEKNNTCLLTLHINEFNKLIEKWNYSIDRLYTAFQNVSKNTAIDIIPLKYSFDTITFLGIIHKSSFKDALDVYISNCSLIFKCEFTYSILGDPNPLDNWLPRIMQLLNIQKDSEPIKTDRHFATELALEYIEKHYMYDISLNVLAEHISLSPYHTSRLFKKYTGNSFINYLNQFRVNKAKELLLKTNKKINEIGNETGFSDKWHFTKTFRRYTEMTPTEYRNKYSI